MIITEHWVQPSCTVFTGVAMRTLVISIVAFLTLSGCAAPAIRVFVPNYPDFPRYPVGYAQTECTYAANSSGKDQNGVYSVRTDSKKVTEGYAANCSSPTDAKKK